jgi:uncharacterized membrane protein
VDDKRLNNKTFSITFEIMAPLIILLVSFGVFFAVNKFLLGGKFSLSFIGRTSLSIMLIATGISHFTNTAPLVETMPDFMPAKRELVYFTGVCELLAVVGLIWTKTAKLTAVMLIIFFVLILPANVIGSLKQVEFGGMQNGAVYLFFRIPLQIFFILWTYYFGIKINESHN